MRRKRSRRISKIETSPITVNKSRRLLPKAAAVATVATQTERNDQATQVCQQVTEEAEAAVATQYDTIWQESRNSWCQTSTSQFFDAAGMYLGCPPQESVPVQTEPYFGATDLTTQCTGRDMNCQTDSFDFYDFESAGTQTDLFDDFLIGCVRVHVWRSLKTGFTKISCAHLGADRRAFSRFTTFKFGMKSR